MRPRLTETSHACARSLQIDALPNNLTGYAVRPRACRQSGKPLQWGRNRGLGGVAERFKALVLKTGISKGIMGSNPIPSARSEQPNRLPPAVRKTGGHARRSGVFE